MSGVVAGYNAGGPIWHSEAYKRTRQRFEKKQAAKVAKQKEASQEKAPTKKKPIVQRTIGKKPKAKEDGQQTSLTQLFRQHAKKVKTTVPRQQNGWPPPAPRPCSGGDSGAPCS